MPRVVAGRFSVSLAVSSPEISFKAKPLASKDRRYGPAGTFGNEKSPLSADCVS